MRPLLSRFSLVPRLGLSCALVAAACLFGACDGHNPDEVPESYGHGSSHTDSFDTHKTDSHPGSESFSDTRGINARASGESAGEHNASSAATPAPHQEDRFGLRGSDQNAR